MASSFVHCHNHGDGSLLDGAQTVKAMVTEVAAQGMPAVAMTDHGSLYYAYDFVAACKDAGVKPIVGLETYLAPGKVSRTERRPIRWASGGEDDVSGSGKFTHMTLLARNQMGLENLQRFHSHSWMTGFYGKPRGDRELLATYAPGLIGTTGCPSGEVQTKIRMGRYDEAREAAAELRDMFDPGSFFVEVMDHGIEVEARALDGLLRISRDLDIPLLATNDTHYTYAHEADLHDAVLCVNSGSTLADEKRFRFGAQNFYLRTAEEMRETWRDYPQACDNTLLVAEMVEDVGWATRDLMPRFDCPDGYTEAEWFEKQVWDGLRDRYPAGVPEDRITQAKYEIGVINDMGFPGYFLVVADFINWAKAQGIRVGPGRGSGAGSIAAYAMRITDIDPIVHGLIFERFLNPDRVSMPDFDIDFDEKRRGEVIEYVTRKYGQERVAMIVTFGKVKAKSALKDAGRVLGFPYSFGDRLTKAYPSDVMGKTMPLSGVSDPSNPRYAEAAEFRSLLEESNEARQVMDLAQGMEGLTRSTGVHAAGVIMSAEPLIDVIPLQRRDADGAIITQFEYPICESLGMVKMDFLGLSNLTTIDEALDNIERNRGFRLDLDELTVTLNDEKTFELLARGDTLGVFQLDGGPMRSLLRSMQPDNFEDISAVLALYRPGPMGVNAHNDYADRKTGRKPVVPIHPELAEPLKDILGDTYGLIVSQEQVMAIAQQLAGYTLGAADLLRRAMGKKKKAELDKQHATFSDGMKANGYSEAAIHTLWETLLPFADYAFNKAHSAAYGVISYYTAYLKAHYPAEYMAALLTTNSDDKDKTAIYLNECRRMGIKVLSPDVNESLRAYTAVGDDIRVGLGAIRNVGDGVIASMVTTRTEKGLFADFNDFLDKIEVTACQKRVIESMIKAGCFDSLGHKRRALDLIHAAGVESVVGLKKQAAIGHDYLFGLFDDQDQTSAGSATVRVDDSIDDWDKMTRLGYERDMLGLYVSDHPLNGVGDLLRVKTDTSIGEVLESGTRMVGSSYTFGGLVSAYERKTTKKGDLWGTFTLEDLDGDLEVLVFPRTFTQYSALLRNDAFVLVQAKVDRKDDDSLKLIAESITLLDVNAEACPDPLRISVRASRLTPDVIGQVKDTFARYPGDTPVHLYVIEDSGVKVWALGSQYRVEVTNPMRGELKAVFGVGCFEPPTPQQHAPEVVAGAVAGVGAAQGPGPGPTGREPTGQTGAQAGPQSASTPAA